MTYNLKTFKINSYICENHNINNNYKKLFQIL